MKCEGCGAEIQPRLARGRFCGSKCRTAAWVRRKQREAAAPLEKALVALADRAEALVEQERAALEGRRAVLADLEGVLQEARGALGGKE